MFYKVKKKEKRLNLNHLELKPYCELLPNLVIKKITIPAIATITNIGNQVLGMVAIAVIVELIAPSAVPVVAVLSAKLLRTVKPIPTNIPAMTKTIMY